MDNTDLLPRRLSAPGCVIAGHQLGAHRKALADEGIKLVKEVAAHADKVAHATEAIVSLGADDARMVKIDRGADRFIGGLDGFFAEIERSFDYGDVLALTAAEQEIRDTARALRAKLFPSGIEFTRWAYRLQWERMNAIHLEMQKPENAAAIKKLGLALWADRFARWVALYGAKLGVTEAKGDTDPTATAVEAWHVAWADFLLEVRTAYRDGSVANHVKARQLLLSPYERQVLEERADDVKADQKAKRREKKEEPAAEKKPEDHK